MTLLKTVVLFLCLLIANVAYGWTEKEFEARPDGSTYWSSEMELDAPWLPTGDHYITTWDQDLIESERVQKLFGMGLGCEVGVVYENGKRTERFPEPLVTDRVGCFRDRSYYNKVVMNITSMGVELSKKFPDVAFAISYFPQFDTYTIYLCGQENMKNVELNKEVSTWINNNKDQFMQWSIN